VGGDRGLGAGLPKDFSDNTPNLPATGSPDDSGFISYSNGAQNGSSDIVAPLNSLLGVFPSNTDCKVPAR